MSGLQDYSITRLPVYLVLIALTTTLARPVLAQDPEPESSRYAFVELGGKGFISVNYDWPIGSKWRMSTGLTALDYELNGLDDEGYYRHSPLPSPGLMVYYLSPFGGGRTNWEVGVGFSTHPIPWKDFAPDDSALTLHGSMGYRYQVPGGTVFRFGFTPFYRVNWHFLPLIGISSGLSF